MSPARLTLPADAEYVGLARLVVCQAARQAGVRDDRVEDVRIAVAEAFASAVRARRARGSDTPVELSFGTSGRDFEVVVTDLEDGLQVGVEDPLDTEPLDPKLGLTVIEGLTDAVDYERGDQGMDLRFLVATG